MLRGEQLLERHPVDLVHLVGRDDLDRARLAPPGQHRGDREVARRQPQLGQLGEDLHAGGVEPGLLLTPRGARPARASRRGRSSRRGRTPGPGWERMWWARSVSSRSGPSGPSPKSIRTAPTARVGVLGRHEPGQVVDRDRAGPGLLDRPQPVREARAARAVTGRTPRCSLTMSTTSSTESRPPACSWATAPSASTKYEQRVAPDLRELVGVHAGRRPGRRARDRWPRAPGPRRARCRGTGRGSRCRARHPVAVLVVELLERRHLLAARRAVGRPQVDHHRSAQAWTGRRRAAAEAGQRDVGQRHRRRDPARSPRCRPRP